MVAPTRTQFAPCQRWFEDVGGVHCAFSATGSNQRVDFVNKEDGTVRSILDFFDDCLQPLFKFPLVLGSSNQGTHVQAEQGHAVEVFRHIALDDAVSNSFGDGGFAHAGFADEERVVFGASAQDLKHASDFFIAPDDRVELAFGGEFVQVACVFGECVVGRLLRSGGGRRTFAN